MSTPATIIVIEDEPGTRATLCGILEDSGYGVIGLGKGAEALEKIQKSPADVIITDIRLPDVDGIEILELAKEINPDTAVIMMTGYASVETAVDAVNQGAYAYFVKPVNPEEIKTAIANALKQQRLLLENKRLVESLQRSNKLLFEANEELKNEITERKRVEEALRESEEKYRGVFDRVPVSIILLDKDGQMVDVNPHHITNIGRGKTTRKGYLGRNFITHPNIVNAGLSETYVRLLKGKPFDLKEVYFPTTLRGTNGYFNVKGVPLFKEGKVIGAVTIIEDITERKRMEEALRESEEFSSSLLSNSPNPILVVNQDTSIRYVNPALEKLTGFSSAEIIGRKHPYPWWPEETVQKITKRAEAAMRKGAERVEELFQAKNGERFWVELNSVQVRRNGEFKYYLTNWIDITERKRIEETLRESEERYRAIFEQAGDSIVLINEETGAVVEFNDKAHETLGYSREEFAKLSLSDIEAIESAEKIKRHLDKITKEGSGYFETQHQTKGGEIRDVQVSARSVYIGGRNFVLSVWRDVTERKMMERELQGKNEQLDAQNEELQSQAAELMAQQQELVEKTKEVEEATRLKSEFLANMSHELRTPLNAVIGFSELMIDEVPGKINEEQRQCLSDILGSSQHLLNLINEVLDLSKIESGKMGLKIENVTLTETIESSGNTMMPIIASREQTLEIEVEDGLPPVRADEAKVTQVLLNLVDNSSKFTPNGGRLKIEAVSEGNWCRVSVVDNGIGIKKEDQERIFEPFCQLDNPTTKGKSGTGLGLTLVKQIVEGFGGRIWVESVYGKGSRFTFTLPLATTNRPGVKEKTGKKRANTPEH